MKNIKVTPRIASGFMELLPSDQIIFNSMLDTIRKVYESFGFLPIETPAVELKKVLLAKGGGETEKQVYRLFAKDAKSGEEIDSGTCLHFDLTVPLARYTAQHQNDLVFPFRRYQIQKVWRGERAQRGRFREFYQCDVDVIGSYNCLHDAEIPAVIYSVFKKLNVPKFVIKINNRKILGGLIQVLKGEEHYGEIIKTIDQVDKIGEEQALANIEQLGLDNDLLKQFFRTINLTGLNDEILDQVESLAKDKSALLFEGILELRAVVSAMRNLGVPEDNFQIDLKIARGLDYYTGTVYETKLLDYPNLGSVCSGGRYDDLCGYYTKKQLPGVGISIGLTRLFYQLKEANLLPSSSPSISQVLVASKYPSGVTSSLGIASKFREAGINCEVYLDYDDLAKQLKYANRLKIPYVVIVDESYDFGKDIVILRNMNNKTQKEMNVFDAIDSLVNG